ncbi:MAG: hypothetical protein FJ082_03250 [Cyanobacteria bacterium K_Offshore_surface_m2_011]|nr:hypothetical protein [Cyanobacteria bacterium K_Offshore_surface_m2_011]
MSSNDYLFTGELGGIDSFRPVWLTQQRRRLAPLGLTVLLALLASPVAAGEITATGGMLGLGSVVNGQLGGSCFSGACAIRGGTSAGANLFHRFPPSTPAARSPASRWTWVGIAT